jgi:hypothetical protein
MIWPFRRKKKEVEQIELPKPKYEVGDRMLLFNEIAIITSISCFYGSIWYTFDSGACVEESMTRSYRPITEKEECILSVKNNIWKQL